MNRKQLFTLLLFSMFFHLFSFAQKRDGNYKITCLYELYYQPDSTDAKNRQTSTMALLLNNDNSLFGSLGNLNYDTLYYDHQIKGTTANIPSSVYSTLDGYNKYRIYKDNKTGIITYDQLQIIMSPAFRYQEPKNVFAWKILNDTATIAGYACQNAECYFGNRKWIAWFTAQIPISDGPYKFCGLPGLIVKVEDAQGYWNFTLTSLAEQSYDYHFSSEFSSQENPLSTTKTKFFAALKNSYDNGYELEQQNGITFMNGKEAEKKRYEQRAIRNNNWIEIYRKRNKGD